MMYETIMNVIGLSCALLFCTGLYYLFKGLIHQHQTDKFYRKTEFGAKVTERMGK